MAERASGKRRDGTFDKPEKGWFYVEEWGLSLARPNSPDSVAEPQTSPTHRVEEEASMLPAWRQSFLKKLEAKAAKDEDEIPAAHRSTRWAAKTCTTRFAHSGSSRA